MKKGKSSGGGPVKGDGEADPTSLVEILPKNEVENDFNFAVYCGAENGTLKGISFGPDTPTLKNFHSFNQDSKRNEIKSLTWMDGKQKELCVAFKDNCVKIYNTKLRSFTRSIDLYLDNEKDGNVVRVSNYLSLAESEPSSEVEDEVADDGSKIEREPAYHSNFLVGLDSGKVLLWKHINEARVLEFSTGNQLSVIRESPINPSIIGTGGKDNDLKIWNLKSENPTIPIFKAKNVPHDNLELKVPVWVQDLTFMPESEELVGLCSRYGHVRFYDPKVNNKGRPVINMNFLDHALMSISATRNNRQVIVGSSQGKMGLIDFRNPKGDLVHLYRGVTGSIRSICAHPELPYFFACGLDRHLYLYNIDKNKPIKKLYLKSRLSCTIMSDEFSLDHHAENAIEEDEPAWQNISMDVLDVSLPSAPSPLTPQPKAKKRKLAA